MARALPWLVLLFVSVMASAAFIVIKYLTGYVSPVELLLLRFLPASIVAIILIVLFYREAVRKLLPRFWWFFLIREAMAVLGFHLSLNYGASVLPAGVAALIVGTWPVMTILLASPSLGERLTLRKVIGGLLAFAGAAVVILFGAAEEAAFTDIAPSEWIRYSLLLLIAPISAAVVTVVSRWWLNRGDGSELPDSFLFTLICRSPSGLFALVVFLAFRQPTPLLETLREVPPLFWVLIAVLAFHNTLFGFWLWNWALQRIQAGKVALFTYTQTVLALAIAWLVLDEPIGPLKLVGAAAIVLGVLVANVEGWPARPPPAEYVHMKVPMAPGQS